MASYAATVARLEDYSFGRVVVDGEEHTRDLIVLPDRVVADWWRRDGHSLALEDLAAVEAELPNRLILGCGAHGRLEPRRPSSTSCEPGGSRSSHYRPPMRFAGTASPIRGRRPRPCI